MSREDEVRTKHPSYGMIRFARRQGGDTNLFGSSIENFNKVSITISRAEHIRDDLKYDRYLPEGDIIEVEMSPSQFAEAIMTMNTQGTPCTIRRIRTDKKLESVESCPIIDKRKQFEKEFQRDMNKLAKTLEKLTTGADELLEKKTINKSDREELKGLLYKLKQDLTSNIPFMYEMFNEQMEKTVNEAKSEVEAFTENKLRSAGMGAVLEELKKSNARLVNIVDAPKALPAPSEDEE